jgi:hypothetical protein
MNATRDRWAGIHTSVQPEPGNDGYDGAYRVSFVWGLMHARGYGGEPRKVATTALARVKAEGGGTVLSVSDYRAPEQPLPRFKRKDFESKALDLVKAWIAWDARVRDLVGRVEQWAKELGWATRPIVKKLYDSRLGDHPEPALVLQEDACRALLEPIGRSAPGVEGVVDLYLMPAYDDIASLYFYDDRWNLHYLPPHQSAAASVREAAGEPLSKKALQGVLEEMKKHAA